MLKELYRGQGWRRSRERHRHEEEVPLVDTREKLAAQPGHEREARQHRESGGDEGQTGPAQGQVHEGAIRTDEPSREGIVELRSYPSAEETRTERRGERERHEQIDCNNFRADHHAATVPFRCQLVATNCGHASSAR